MQWQNTGIILNLHKHGEHGAIVSVFTRDYGIAKGYVRGVHSKKQRGVLQPGNIVNVNWSGRLADQLGTFTIELHQALAPVVMQNANRLAAMNALTALLYHSCAENDAHPRLYEVCEAFLTESLRKEIWLVDYIKLELVLLSELGFGLDLASCVATGRSEDLAYVSPKSGCAVSRSAGDPYKNKLLTLPAFLGPQPDGVQAGGESLNQGLDLCEYFLDKHCFAAQGKRVPEARLRLKQVCATQP